MKRRAAVLLLGAALAPSFTWAVLSGPPITDNNYRVDLSHGVAVGSTEQIGMGGADVARAHAASGLADNPAAVAVRLGQAPGDHDWDWDGDLGSFTVGGKDFDNNGSASTAYSKHVVTHVGGLLRYRNWGGGIYELSQQYRVMTAGVVRKFEFDTSHLLLGRSWMKGSLVAGLGFRIAEYKAGSAGPAENPIHLSGGGFVGGLQWNPSGGPYRFGLAHEGSIQDDPRRSLTGAGLVKADGLIVPKGVDLPAETSLGMAYMGSRWLLAADLDVTSRVKEAVGIDSFLEQRVQRSGRRATVGPRLGLQDEVLPGRFRLRAGTYFEPSRFENVSGRWHGTTGFEARLFKVRVFGERYVSVSYALDAAPRYVANFLSLGFWH